MKSACIPFVCVMILILTICSGCPAHDPELTYPFHSAVSMKDGTVLTLDARFLFSSPLGVEELKGKDQKIKYALNLAMSEHTSSEFNYQGKTRISNLLASIARQVLYTEIDRVVVDNFKFSK